MIFLYALATVWITSVIVALIRTRNFSMVADHATIHILSFIENFLAFLFAGNINIPDWSSRYIQARINQLIAAKRRELEK